MPGVAAYFVLPARSAAAQASLINSGVSKSGSPAAKLHTSSPAALSAFALASMASVGDGAIFWAQTDKGEDGVVMAKAQRLKGCVGGTQVPPAAAVRRQTGGKRYRFLADLPRPFFLPALTGSV